MPIRRYANFDHLPDGVIPWQTNNTSGLPYIYGANTSGSVNVAVFSNQLDESKWLGSDAGSVYTCFDVRQLFLDTTKKSIFGFRSYCTNVAQYRIGGFYSPSSGGVDLAASTVNGGTLGGPNIAANVEQYIEVVMDWVNYSQTVYVNGQPKFSRTFTQANMALFMSTYYGLVVGAESSAAGWRTKDWYFADQVGSENLQPTGGLVVRPGQLLGASGASYAPQGNMTLAQQLGSKMTDLRDMYWPNAHSLNGAASGDIAINGVAVDFLGSQNVIGAELWASGRNQNAATTRNLTAKATLGGQSTVGTPKALPTGNAGILFGGFNLNMSLAPDGAAWTPAKLANTVFAQAAS